MAPPFGSDCDMRKTGAVESATTPESTAPHEGLPEHITDRAIERKEEDRFGHQDFVNRLLTIIQATETPANIALFGRWGSGKTGISNRLETEVDKLVGFKFAPFDAFKFARLPLLRRFLIRLAHELGGEDTAAEYRRRVYERKEAVRLNKLTDAMKARLWRWTERSLVVTAIAIWAFNALLFIFTPAERSAAVDLLAALLPILLPAGLIAAGGAFAARHLTATTTTEAPSSEEQFEALFSDLLKAYDIGPEKGQKKLVVFVDELDRCSAREVALTLDSIKTFLDVPGCVFIVAADQKVLEHALTQRVRQATPRDVTNPYYSAGSAYLDKIFQYQINLPPLFPGRLTGFAVDLLSEVGGVWDEVPSKEGVVSVLLPVHVRSPRRVKVLLNAFAQAFAIALDRARSKRLDENVKERAEEIAKLVGLQREFPLFAADLASHRNLPALVLACADAIAAGEEPEELEVMKGVPEDTQMRALGFARGELATDATLDGHGAEKNNDEAAMRIAQRSDLIDYLRQTALVAGPTTDLVHLERRGIASGIDEALATELEELALRNRPAIVREQLEALEEDEREPAILWLGELVRESRANDADNAIRALLAAFPTAGASVRSVAKDLLAAVVRYDRDRELGAEELSGALELAILGDSTELKVRILQRPEAMEEPLRAYTLERAPLLIDNFADRLGELFAAEIISAPEEAARRLIE